MSVTCSAPATVLAIFRWLCAHCRAAFAMGLGSRLRRILPVSPAEKRTRRLLQLQRSDPNRARVPSPEFDCAAPQPARRPKLREVIVSDCTKLGPADTTPRRAAK